MTSRTFRVVAFTKDADTIDFDGPGISKPSAQEAVEAWKEDACEQAALSLGEDEDEVNRNQEEIYDMKNDLLEGRIAHSEFFDNYAALVEDFNNGVAVLCYDIQWDGDGATGLPEMLVIHTTMDEFEDEGDESLSDALSNITGFCHKGFKTQVVQ